MWPLRKIIIVGLVVFGLITVPAVMAKVGKNVLGFVKEGAAGFWTFVGEATSSLHLPDAVHDLARTVVALAT